MKLLCYSLLVAIAFVATYQQPAHAYLDPGTGSYTAQVILAGALVGVFSLRSFLIRVGQSVTRLFQTR